jgi:hypothetical protein
VTIQVKIRLRVRRFPHESLAIIKDFRRPEKVLSQQLLQTGTEFADCRIKSAHKHLLVREKIGHLLLDEKLGHFQPVLPIVSQNNRTE